MYILTRYVIWEVLKYFLVTLVALTLVVTPVMGINEGLKKGAPIVVILQILPVILPEILGITIPASMLFSICTVFGRMTGANEVVALKSLGISPMAVIWPAIVLASFVSLGTVWMYELAATKCRPARDRILAESIEKIAYSVLVKSPHSFGTPDDPFSITVKRVAPPLKPGDPPTLVQPMITIKGPPKTTISAAEATLRADLKTHQLQIRCRAGDVVVEGGAHLSFPDWQDRMVPIPVPTPDRYHRDWVAMRDIPDLVAELQPTLRTLEGLYEAKKVLDPAESAKDAEKVTEYRRLISRLKTEPYRRWANGFTCLCFALIGIPVAMLWRHADALTNFFVCFLPILAIYYPLLLLGEDLSTSGKLWPIAFWMANVIIVIPAIALLRQVVRH